MNEEIKKNEIPEDNLEQVSGGAVGFAANKVCPECGGRIMFYFDPETNIVSKPICVNCGLKL